MKFMTAGDQLKRERMSLVNFKVKWVCSGKLANDAGLKRHAFELAPKGRIIPWNR